MNPSKSQHNEKLPPPHSLVDEIIAHQPEDLFNKEVEYDISQSDRLAAIGRLSVALVHDINSPLQIILGYLDLILDFSVEESERIQYLNMIRDEIKRLSVLTNHIIDYTQPRSDIGSPVFVLDVLERALLLTDKLLKEKSINVDVRVEKSEALTVTAVTEEVEQVFLNLIINAYDAMPKFGDLIIMAQPVNKNICISFENTGEPISEELMERIFEPFFSTKVNNGGLGLWISRYLIESQGGTLAAANRNDGKGAIFTVVLPQMIV